ncbi:hypothetical protein ILP97_00895 [Amycolatopsis sp. H6(2020)]|nr:hypothetical protein [Amycolatopsis sp. H6(2020)]
MAQRGRTRPLAAAVAGAAGAAGMLLAPAAQAATEGPHAATTYFLCDYDTAHSNGYLYVRNDGARMTCFANAGSADVWIGNSAYFCSFNNAGKISYVRPGIAAGTVYFGKNQCGGFESDTTVTNVTIY